MTLIDSDVLIWCLRGRQSARDVVESADTPAVSAVTRLELIQGARSKTDLRYIEGAFLDLELPVEPITPSACAKAESIMVDFGLSHGVSVTDALIAGCALSRGATVLTANRKHFAMVRDLSLRIFVP